MTMHVHCKFPSAVSPSIGTAQEVVHASLGYEQSKLISSHLTLVSVYDIGVQPIILRGNSHALWRARHPMMMMMMWSTLKMAVKTESERFSPKCIAIFYSTIKRRQLDSSHSRFNWLNFTVLYFHQLGPQFLAPASASILHGHHTHQQTSRSSTAVLIGVLP